METPTQNNITGNEIDDVAADVMLSDDDSEEVALIPRQRRDVEQDEGPGESLDEIGIQPVDNPTSTISTRSRPGFDFDAALPAHEDNKLLESDEVNVIKDYLSANGLALTDNEVEMLETMAHPVSEDIQRGTVIAVIDNTYSRIPKHNQTFTTIDMLAELEIQMRLNKVLLTVVEKATLAVDSYARVMSTDYGGGLPHPDHDRCVQESLGEADRIMLAHETILDHRINRLNRARAPSEKIDWSEAADTTVPSEKIHVDDAGPLPKTIHDVTRHRYRRYLMKAMMVEMDSMATMKVFSKLPKTNQRTIPTKWVFAYKTDPMGFIEKFKARMVAVGCRQVDGVDYNETHSPVVKSKVLRILMAMSAVLGHEIGQLDVITAYLNGTVKENIHITLPPGFEETDEHGRPLIAKLEKALYGLKQAGREWFLTIRNHLIGEGFSQFNSDPCTFVRVDSESQKLVFLIIYVDDMIITSTGKGAVERVKDDIKKTFKIKDIPDVQWVLRIQFERFEDGIWFGLPEYTKQVLQEIGEWDTPEKTWASTPMVPGWKHDPLGVPLTQVENDVYVRIVAKLLYLAVNTRPDIMFTVNTLAQFQRSPPNEGDWIALLRVLRYLRKTWDWGLFYQANASLDVLAFTSSIDEINEGANQMELPEGMAPLGYADASYAEEFDRKSRSAYVFLFLGCVVSWYSKKQSTTSLSSTEAELNALVEAVKEAKWMREFLTEMGFNMKASTNINEDNQSAIAIASNPIHHSRIKHLEVKARFLQENLEGGNVRLTFCPTELMLADILTKALAKAQHLFFCELMGLRSLARLHARNVEDKARRVVLRDNV